MEREDSGPELDAREKGARAAAAIIAGDLDAAERLLMDVLASGFLQGDTMANLGSVAFHRGNAALAAEWYEKSLAIDAGQADVLSNLAACMLRMNRPEEALAYAHAALALDPDELRAHTHRGVALTDLLRPDEALPALFKGLHRNPDDVGAILNLARTYREINRYADAVSWYTRALALDPGHVQANFSRGLAYLQMGDFATGFAAYEWRWQTDSLKSCLPKHGAPRWIGQFDVRGKTLLLEEEQGFGDTLQFSRYALLLAEQGVKVVLRVRPALRALFACFEDRMTVVAHGDPLPPFDCFTPLMSLPFAVGTTIDTIPRAPRYLAAPAERRLAWASRLGPRTRPRIGIVWSGQPKHGNDRARSMALSAFPIPNPALFDVFSFQKEVRAGDQPVLDSLDITQLGPAFQDMADTAAAVELMDLVISVDTSVAHLAAALGKPTWLLLPSNADWRWIHGRDTSDWYPTMRLFRQAAPGAWSEVNAAVTRALAEAAGLAQA